MEKGQDLDIALAKRMNALAQNDPGHTDEAIADMKQVLDVIQHADYSDEPVREKLRFFADWICPGENGYRSSEVAVRQDIGITCGEHGRLDEAAHWLEHASNLSREINDNEGAAISLSHLGRVLAPTSPARARQSFEDGLRLARSVGRRSTEGRCLLGLAGLEAGSGNAQAAILHSKAALDIFIRLGMDAEARQSSAVLESARQSGPRRTTRFPHPAWMKRSERGDPRRAS